MKNYLTLITLFVATSAFAQVDFDKKLKDLGITLPPPSTPVANYVKAVRTGNLIFLAGHAPQRPDGSYVVGKLGRDMTIEQGYEASRLTALALLSTLKAQIGDFNKVKHVVKITGMVNCTEDFGDQPKVINGCSDLLVAVFGDKGKHARSAVGMNSLPFNSVVQIEMVVEVE